jgi:uncharacterized protein (DUF433 family)
MYRYPLLSREELESEREWDKRFAESQSQLDQLAREALDEHQEGQTRRLNPNKCDFAYDEAISHSVRRITSRNPKSSTTGVPPVSRQPQSSQPACSLATFTLTCYVLIEMPEMINLAERITVDPEQCGGRPCVRGMRIRVSDVLDLLANGLTPKQIIEELPDLESEDVAACLRFASRRLDHPVVAA